MPEDFVINGEVYTLIKERRMGGAVFVNTQETKYARVGEVNDIHGEVNLTKELASRNFPVPKVIEEGPLKNSLHYYIEEAVGTRPFGEKFKEETDAYGHVQDETFDAYTEVVLTYAKAQFHVDNFVPRNRADIARTILLENVLRNDSPSDAMKAKFYEALKRASENLLKLPFGYLQSDFNAYNILEHGVIDFEHSSFGPVGFDIMTNVTFGRFWPRIARAYHITDEQMARYDAKIDALAQSMGLPKMSDYVNDFMVMKAIRATHRGKDSEDHPLCNAQFWKWRQRVRDWCIERYLKEEPIDTGKFQEIGGVVTEHPEHIGH